MFFGEEVVRPLTADERALVRVELGQEDRADGADLSATLVFGSPSHPSPNTFYLQQHSELHYSKDLVSAWTSSRNLSVHLKKTNGGFGELVFIPT